MWQLFAFEKGAAGLALLTFDGGAGVTTPGQYAAG